jgi:hypothetical protein
VRKGAAQVVISCTSAAGQAGRQVCSAQDAGAAESRRVCTGGAGGTAGPTRGEKEHLVLFFFFKIHMLGAAVLCVDKLRQMSEQLREVQGAQRARRYLLISSRC